jgi:succinoglycan biosynthesis protein ExoM
MARVAVCVDRDEPASTSVMTENAAGRIPRICVAVPTYRRPEQLAALLSALAKQTFPADTDIVVAIFDNDRSPSAALTVERFSADFPVRLLHRHTPEPGLSAVRNAAVAYACDGFDYLAMIDDDEEPEPHWLSELFAVATRTDADATFGPVIYLFPEGPAGWLGAGGFFAVPTPRDGSRVDFGYSGNCFLRTTTLKRFGVTFDRAFNLAGGEDMLFFLQLKLRGASMVFAERAITKERVSPERLRARYVLQLNYRRGNTLALCDARIHRGWTWKPVRALKGVARLVRGTSTSIPLTILRGRVGALTAACDVAHGLGSLVGIFGGVYRAYDRLDA